MSLPLHEIEVTIRNLAFGAGGVGDVTTQLDGNDDLIGIAAFVPFTIPGEKIRAQIVEKKKKYVLAHLLTLISRSPNRIEPKCPFFEVCGGCELQHIDYESQLILKQQMIRGSMLAGSIPIEVVEKLKPIQRSSPYGYRRRVTLHIDSEGNTGFYRTNSRIVVPIERCAISSDNINDALPNVIKLIAELKGLLSSVSIENDTSGNIIVLKSPYGLTSSQLQRIEKAARSNYFTNVLITAQGKEVGGFGRQILQLPLTRLYGKNIPSSLELNVPAGYFSQINWDINLAIIEKITTASSITRNSSVLDLYAGAGNFSLPLARIGGTVIAVESDTRLTALARDNIRKNKLEKHLKVVSSSVEHFLKTPDGRASYDVIIADPPRSGLGALVHSLPKAKKLLYVSCSLPSFVRDLRNLLAQGWHVSFIEPYDMFAQTSYVEILTLLTRE